MDLAPGTTTRLRILDFPVLDPPVREWIWETEGDTAGAVELEWCGRDVRVGAAELHVEMHTHSCAALEDLLAIARADAEHGLG